MTATRTEHEHTAEIAVKAKIVIAPLNENDADTAWSASVQITAPTEGQCRVLGVFPTEQQAETAVAHWKAHTLPSLLAV
jgi:hypothetical protein